MRWPTSALLSAMKHWVLCSVPLLPMVPRVQSFPASFNRDSAFAARSYDSMQESAAAFDASEALNQAHTVDRSVAPAVSEYCSAKVCVVPVPPLGVTRSGETVDCATGNAVNVLSVYCT